MIFATYIYSFVLGKSEVCVCFEAKSAKLGLFQVQRCGASLAFFDLLDYSGCLSSVFLLFSMIVHLWKRGVLGKPAMRDRAWISLAMVQATTGDNLPSSAGSCIQSQTHAPEPRRLAKVPEAPIQQAAADPASWMDPPHLTMSDEERGPLLLSIPNNESTTEPAPHQTSPLQSPNRHIERLKEQIMQPTDTPWPGLCISNSPTGEKAQLRWPGLDGPSQQSTTEAELPALQGSCEVMPGPNSPQQAYSPTWVEAERAQSPDSPLSLSGSLSRRNGKAKRGHQRTYFNSSRSISSAESSPRCIRSSPISANLLCCVPTK